MGCGQQRLGCQMCSVVVQQCEGFVRIPKPNIHPSEYQISWRTVYNLFVKSLGNKRWHGRGRRRRHLNRDPDKGRTEEIRDKEQRIVLE